MLARMICGFLLLMAIVLMISPAIINSENHPCHEENPSAAMSTVNTMGTQIPERNFLSLK